MNYLKVASAVIVKDDKVLLSKRSMQKTFLPGEWELIGGHVDAGETFEEALHRELMEEMNVEKVIDRVVHSFMFLQNRNGKVLPTIEIIFRCHLKDKLQIPQPDGEECECADWFNLGEAEQKFASRKSGHHP